MNAHREFEIRITLLDGRVLTEKASVPATHPFQAIGAMLQSIASTGVLKYNATMATFVVDPTPSQIVRVEATQPALVVAPASVLHSSPLATGH